jgi:hypothetical protein
MSYQATASMAAEAALRARAGVEEATIAPPFNYDVVCRGADGREKWRDGFRNLVTTVGRNLIGNIVFRDTAKSAGWYVGLKGAGTPLAADTMASHANWSEVTDYDEADRQTLTLAAFSSATSNNTAAPAVFNINATVTVTGCFVVDSATKGGSAGTLYSLGDFSVARALDDGDELTVSVVESV